MTTFEDQRREAFRPILFEWMEERFIEETANEIIAADPATARIVELEKQLRDWQDTAIQLKIEAINGK